MNEEKEPRTRFEFDLYGVKYYLYRDFIKVNEETLYFIVTMYKEQEIDDVNIEIR